MKAKSASKEPAATPGNIEPSVMTIDEFCAKYRIARLTLYKMRHDGTGPDVIAIGRKLLITQRAALEWEQRRIERKPEATGALTA